MTPRLLRIAPTVRHQLHSCTTTLVKKNKLPPRPKLTVEIEPELEEKFLHGGRGPGGQKINKCNSKVQLKHVPSGIVVECQETRSREQNRKIAREKLALQLAIWQNGGNPTARQTALHEWEKQGKRSRERKSRDKHDRHGDARRQERLKEVQEEEQLLESLLRGKV
ncbi:LAME_0G10264g1_1 [Lachancea meyersii CBS 8951]|uniref:LAME_0G10264g1_1 n=1 Tax=Lachancea meyersii CBS 8951 TaxID=1266667 RepID=A0A1G4K8W5_9SACH|nr:LAME_0G10264g1_1 [Lachancea meyersii CBS 8951]